MDALTKYKCNICKSLPSGDVYVCSKHLVCDQCILNADLCAVTGCFNKILKTTNPLLEELAKTKELLPCQFSGCTWTFTKSDMVKHVTECRYRAMNCIGDTMGIWKCNWIGQPVTIDSHFHAGHPEVDDFFSYFQDSSVPFDNRNTIGTINLIEAYSKFFIFYFQSNANTKMVYFAITLIGRKVDADKFYYEFTIKSPIEPHRKIKFVENIYNDNVSIKELRDNGTCVNLSHSTIKNHLCENNINFRFIINKRETVDKVSLNGSASHKPPKPENKPAANTVKPAAGFAVKGTLKSNTTKRGNSVPSAVSSSASASKPTSNAVQTNPSPALPTIHERSSINKVTVRDGLCHAPGLIEAPCMMPSINRMEEPEEKLLREAKIISNGPVATTPKQKFYKCLSQAGENSFGKVKYK